MGARRGEGNRWLTYDELADALEIHKKICIAYDREGAGIDMFTAPVSAGAHA